MTRFTWLVVLVLVGCGGDVGEEPDAGGDASQADASTMDGAVSADAAVDGGALDAAPDARVADAGSDAGSDAGPIDAGERPDVIGPACDEGIGAPCDPGPCPSGFECTVGRCIPQGRPICGGIAGWECTGAEYSECLHLVHADFGPCVTPSEFACGCDRARDAFICP